MGKASEGRRAFLGLLMTSVSSLQPSRLLKTLSSMALEGGRRRFGVLVDLTACIGCRSCYVACKLKQGFPSEKKGNLRAPCEPHLSEITYTEILPRKVGDTVRFVKVQCMHCIDPACASACTVGAIYKLEDGPVVVNQDKCVGCRYCQIACPFSIPKFQWSKNRSVMAKCDLCFDRVLMGLKPACVEVCPVNALVFGYRDELLKEARRRISTGKYVNHIYGEYEAGGTTWIYISDVPFSQLGFPTVRKWALPKITSRWFEGAAPIIATIVLALLAGLRIYTGKRKSEGGGKD